MATAEAKLEWVLRLAGRLADLLKTLHYYLWRELLKVTLLGLMALTLLLTIFAIIEPLRKQQGMAAEQILALFGYTLPIMLSLTLPMGALFAAAIVYGRFGQDNELLACRASGISTINLLRPALVLGLLVTAMSLILSNFVAPRMAASSETTLKQNLKGITYRQLRSRGYIKFQSNIVRADDVDEKNDILHGLVFADGRSENDIRILVASSARLAFRQIDDAPYLQITAANPRATRTASNTIVIEDSQEFVRELDNPVKERPSWMDWKRLLEAASKPYLTADISRSVDKISRDILHHNLATAIADGIASKGMYDGLLRNLDPSQNAASDEQYVIYASSANVVTDSAAKRNPKQLKSMRIMAELAGSEQGVRVEVKRNGKVVQTYEASLGRVEAKWSEMSEMSYVSLILEGPVTVTTPGQSQPQRRDKFEVGQLPIPDKILNGAQAASHEDIFYSGSKYTGNPEILHEMNVVSNYKTKLLLNEIKAEMHGRVAYSLSCFLLVSLGAALGLIFRGGQFISAFAIAALPGSMVMILVLQGKKMMENPDVSNFWGPLVIWSGIGMMLLANLIVYSRLVRR